MTMAAKTYFSLIFILFFQTANAGCLGKYDRKYYPHWQRLSHSMYQDVRQKVVASSVVSGLTLQNGRVVSGIWYDPFTGQNYDITEVNPDIDHLVSLKWAHSRGANCFDYKTRKALANDPDNLWAVHPSANRQKGASISDWLPANLGMCTSYLKQIKIVVEKYNLRTTREDVRIYNSAVNKCYQMRNGIKIKKVKRWYNFWRN